MYVNKSWSFMEYYFSALEGDFLSSAGALCINGSTRINKAFCLVMLGTVNELQILF